MADVDLGDEYPKHVYQDGGDDLIDGKAVRSALVHDADEEGAYRSKGWRLLPHAHPLDHDGNGDLGGSLPRRGHPPKSKETSE